MTINPLKFRLQTEAYLSRSLGGPASLLDAQQLAQSTREAPWKLDFLWKGEPRALVLRLGDQAEDLEQEFQALEAIQFTSIPAPRPYGWDPDGAALGLPCFLSDFIDGESLLEPVLAGESWAIQLYLDSVIALQSVTPEQLGSAPDSLLTGETALDVLENAWDGCQPFLDPLLEQTYRRLKQDAPRLPDLRFSNGDLWLDNFLTRDRHLVGVIDFENAGFSDPIFEFLLSFFVRPELRAFGIEQQYCQRMGFDPALLPWYHGLELFDTLAWVLERGQPFEQYTPERLRSEIQVWLGDH